MSEPFGSCCAKLKQALDENPYEGSEYSRFIFPDDDGVLRMMIGYMPVKEGGVAWIREPVSFCPFCGTRLQPDFPATLKPAERH